MWTLKSKDISFSRYKYFLIAGLFNNSIVNILYLQE